MRVLARKPRLSNGLRVPTICPPTRRKSGGEIQFRDHLLRISGVVSASAPRDWAPWVRQHSSVGEPIEFPRRSCGAETLRLSALSSSLLKIVKRRVSVGYAEVGVGKWWVRKRIPDQRNTIRSVERSRVESTRTEDCPGREGFQGRSSIPNLSVGNLSARERARDSRSFFWVLPVLVAKR